MESDTWEGRENLGNAKEAIEEFEREYQWDIEEVNWQEREKGIFERGELPGRFMAKKLFRWSDKKYDKEYWGRLERNWRQWKRGQPKKRRTIVMIREEEEKDKSGIREWTEEDNEKMGNMVDPYYEL